MRIVHVVLSRLPAVAYGGIERVVWWLAGEQAARGNSVVLLAGAGTSCPFAEVRVRDPRRPIEEQIPAEADVVHFHFVYRGELAKPYVVTVHGSSKPGESHHRNSVFLSRNHAERHGSDVFVYNGIDPAEYGDPSLDGRRGYFHFLGKAAWSVKNVRGAIRVARRAGVRLHVLGGYRLNFNMGFRFTPYRSISFAGMVGGEEKNRLIARSRGLIFPVLWHEPFGLAIVESLYLGCPVFGTPYGALPELVPPDVGVLSRRTDELVEAVRQADAYSPARCHAWVREHFTAAHMADGYESLYGRVVAGEALHAEEPVARLDGPCILA